MSPLLLACIIAQSAEPSLPPTIAAKLVPLSSANPTADQKGLEVIGKAIGDAKVVAMGEATHGTKEFFQMKHRVFRYLAERHKFKVFALEASMPDCLAMDRFVTKGEGAPKAALAKQGFWTWNTQEVLDLLLWMREFNKNKSAKDQLRVYGFDMQSKSGAMDYFAKLDKPINEEWWIEMDETRLSLSQKAEVRSRAESLIQKLGQADQPMARMVLQCLFQAEENEWLKEFNELRAQVVPMLSEYYIGAETLLKKLETLSAEAKEWLGFVVEHKQKPFDLKDREGFTAKLVKAKSSMEASASAFPEMSELWKEQLLFIEFLEMAVLTPENPRFFDHREKCMAQNIIDGMNKIFNGQKVFVWAHNSHVSSGAMGEHFRFMGAYCQDQLKQDYFPIGFAFSQGSFRASSGTGLQNFTVKSAPKDYIESSLADRKLSMAWLDTAGLSMKVKTRSIGAMYDPSREQLYIQEFVPADHYRGMILLDKTTAAKGL